MNKTNKTTNAQSTENEVVQRFLPEVKRMNGGRGPITKKRLKAYLNNITLTRFQERASMMMRMAGFSEEDINSQKSHVEALFHKGKKQASQELEQFDGNIIC